MPILFFTLLLSAVAVAAAPSSGDYLKFPLVHTTPYPPSPSEALAADNRRLSDLAKRSHPRLSVISAASSGSGQYLVTLHLGSPPQRLLLVADTGSDLTWVSCSACSRQCSGRAAAGFFPRRSSSFSPYHCFDSECNLVPPPKPATRCNHTRLHSACRYEYSYSDGSTTRGFFSHETMEFNTSAGKLERFSHLSFGCGFSHSEPNEPGPSSNGPNGVLGLGRGPISFFTQMGQVFGHKFSYCLKDYTLSPPPTSYLLIGGGSSVVTEQKLSYTKLLTNPLSPTFYYVKIDGVIVNDVKLPISPSVWSIDELGNGGTVLDSGTTLTYLASPAYREILAAFRRLQSARRSSGFDFCLNTTSSSETSLPRLSFKLDGGSDYSPPPRNYFIDTPEGVTCLAVRPATSTGFSVIGNLMQQGFTFEFDRDLGRVGYTRSGCGSP